MPGPVERKKLTPEQAELAAEAWKYGQILAGKFAETCLAKLDYDGPVALRLVEKIPSFDPAKSSLKTWAYNQAWYACMDVRRTQISPTVRRVNKRRAKIISIHFVVDGVRPEEVLVAPESDPEIDIDDEVLRLLSPLDKKSRVIVHAAIAMGRRQKDVAIQLGFHESWISQVVKKSLVTLHQHWSASCP